MEAEDLALSCLSSWLSILPVISSGVNTIGVLAEMANDNDLLHDWESCSYLRQTFFYRDNAPFSPNACVIPHPSLFEAAGEWTGIG